MLCEVQQSGNLFITYLFLTFLGVVSTFGLSLVIFYYYYMNVTYEKWVNKSNTKFPSPKKVKSEIILMLKGCYTATICPALALWLSQHGYSQAYCGLGEYGWGYLAFSFVFAVLVSDFLEFYYHRLGHVSKLGWAQHRWHHLFPNPTPFAVIADEYVDQFFRSAPLLLLTLVMPINMDMLFFIYAVFFYAYGVYLHWGYEVTWLDAHHPILNTAFQHYLHHNKSTLYKPYHTGFYFKIWDQMFGSVWDGDCFCAKCEKNKGNRTIEHFKKVKIPDYTVMYKPKFWVTENNIEENAKEYDD